MELKIQKETFEAILQNLKINLDIMTKIKVNSICTVPLTSYSKMKGHFFYSINERIYCIKNILFKNNSFKCIIMSTFLVG